MRLKTLILCSSAPAILASLAAPAFAQATPPVDAPGAITAQPGPNDPDAAPAQADDGVDVAGESEMAGEGDGEEIVVTGLRRSLQSAQQIKRNSDQIVDVVVAEDIGKLPDINVSESLARITGVQVDRSNGEGGRIRVRGLPDLTTTYNGREIFTAEVRNVATQDFAAGTVAALEVYKSTTADQVEGGLAGLVNVRSRRPFDFDGLEIAGSLNGTYADQRKSYDYNGNLLVSNRWDTGIGEIGALVNVSYTQLKYLDSARFAGGFIATSNAAQSSVAPFRFPDAVGIFYGEGKRWRPAVNAALQWRPTPELEVYADGLYQGFRREVADRRLFVPLFGDVRFTNVQLTEGTNQAQSLTVANAVAPFLFQGATKEKTDTYQFAVGAVYRGERLKLSVDLARTDTQFDQSVYSFDTAFVRAPTFNVDFDVPREDGGVEFAFDGFDTENPANYNFGGLFDRQLTATGDDIQFRADAEYETGLNFLTKIAGGIRIVNRDSGFDLGQDFRGPPGPTPLTAVPVDLQVIDGGFRGSDVQPTRTWITPTYRSIRDNVGAIRRLVGFENPDEPRPDNLADRFRVNEEAWGAYGQLSYGFDVGGVGIDGVAGVRAVITDTSTRGAATTRYTDVLPNISSRIRFTDRFQLRGAYTQTRTRPNFDQLRPSIIDPIQGNVQTIRGGNPNLRPLKSDNYDVSLEYYFSRTGFASVGAFRRDLDGFIFGLTTVENVPVGDPRNPLATPLRIDTTLARNAGPGRLQGIEAQFTSFFDFEFVPEWVRGFGIQANYTYVDGEQEFPSSTAGDAFNAQFLDVSKHTYNIVGLYEQGKLSTRLTYNRRSRFFTGYDNSQAGTFTGEYTAPVSRLDFAINYTPIENITLAADVSNILAKPFRNFREYDLAGSTFPRDVRFEERVYSVGVRFRL